MLLWWIESAVLPRIDIADAPAAAGAEQSGTLVAPLTLFLLIDESGWMWCLDAIVPPFVLVTAADERVEVKVEVGSVQLPPRLGERVPRPGESAAWLTPANRGRRVQRILPVGTRVQLSGGQRGDTWIGTPASPLLASFAEGD